ncbi:MAG TPA: non-canonical purine NTP pyrophosphatase, partial [Gemmatimonadales bacterium]
MKLLVATRSPGKTREIRELLAVAALQVSFPDELGLERLPEEDDLEQTDSYSGNAVAKARHFAQRSGLPTLADDSGLEVDALSGAPGVHSARFALEQGSVAPGQSLDAANNALLLARLSGVPPEQR